jgi:hypothetical protein
VVECTLECTDIDAGSVILSAKQLNNKFSMEDFMQEYEEYAEDLEFDSPLIESSERV